MARGATSSRRSRRWSPPRPARAPRRPPGTGSATSLDAQVPGPVQDRRPHGITTAFSAAPPRCAASAAPVPSSANRRRDQLVDADRPARSSASAARMSRGPADQLAVTRSSRSEHRPAVDRQRRARRRRRVDAAAARRAPARPPRRRSPPGSRRAHDRDVDRLVAVRGRAPRLRARQPPGSGSRTQTASTPRACAAAMCSSPLQPAPTTSSASPGRSPARPCARSAQRERLGARSRPPGRARRAGAARRPARAATRTYSAKPPGSSAVERNRSHSVSWPCRQRRHSPHGAWWWIATRSPTAHAAHPGADRDDLAGRLVAEHRGQLARDVPVLDVGAAGRAREHAADDVARAAGRVGVLLDPRVAGRDGARDPHATAATRVRRHRPRDALLGHERPHQLRRA